MSRGGSVICAIGLLFVATLEPPVRAQQQENARVTTDAYIYLYPDSTRKPFARLEAESLVTILGVEGDWYNITILDTKGERRYGYVRQRAIERLPPILRTNRVAAPTESSRTPAVRPSAAAPPGAAPAAPKAGAPAPTRDTPSMTGGLRIAPSTPPRRTVVVTQRGDSVEGMLKNANAQAITLEVAGQDIRFKVDELKSVSFGGTPAAEAPAPKPAKESTSAPAVAVTSTRARLDDALKAFAELRYATEIGMLRRQYSEKLVETMTRAKAFTDGPGEEWADVRQAMLTAIHYYQQPLDTLKDWKNASTDWSIADRRVKYAETLAVTDEATHKEDPSEQVIGLDQTVSGRLGNGDRVMSRELDRSSAGHFNDVYQLTLRSPARIAIQMESALVSPHLTLLDAKHKRIEADGGYFAGAAIKRRLPAGTYYIWAGAMGEHDRLGTYTLSVHSLP